MTQFKHLDDHFFVHGQIDQKVIDAAKQANFNAIVNNRPDMERPPLSSKDARLYTEKAGMEYHYLPMGIGFDSAAALEGLIAIVTKTDGKILAHCKSGMRSASLWAMAMAKLRKYSVAQILSQAEKAGFDLSAICQQLHHLRGDN